MILTTSIVESLVESYNNHSMSKDDLLQVLSNMLDSNSGRFSYVIHEDYITLIHGDLKLNVHKQMFSDLFIFLLKTNMTIQEMEKVWLSYNKYNF